MVQLTSNTRTYAIGNSFVCNNDATVLQVRRFECPQLFDAEVGLSGFNVFKHRIQIHYSEMLASKENGTDLGDPDPCRFKILLNFPIELQDADGLRQNLRQPRQRVPLQEKAFRLELLSRALQILPSLQRRSRLRPTS